ncbi:MAG: ribonuclease HII [Clostridia bacterium]|nr:ribonuclease HII [Clostridia bacterium]
MNWDIENQAKNEGHNIICGCDEAGRGPLAGPVFAAAVILPHGIDIPALNDSKKLTEKQREKLFDIITETAVDYAIASASVEEIEEINILNASMLAMKRAIESLKTKPDYALIDGNIARGFDVEARPVIKGDALSPSIAAASILAKVSRDRHCMEMDKEYPEYGFAKHKGYATKDHREAVLKHGASPVHRKSFLKKLLGN